MLTMLTVCHVTWFRETGKIFETDRVLMTEKPGRYSVKIISLRQPISTNNQTINQSVSKPNWRIRIIRTDLDFFLNSDQALSGPTSKEFVLK